jgi:molecular chaperone GrpE
MLAALMTDSPENGNGGAANDAEPNENSQPAPAPDPLEVAKADNAKLRDQLLRTAADFDNYRKRSRRDVEDAHKKGSEELLKALLPVFDNLERAVMHAEQTADAKAIAEGVKMVLKQFTDALAKVGIKRVGGVGQPFDPLVHEAIQQVETTEHPAGTVVAEVQPGYAFGDRLIRAAMVVVARPPAKAASEPPKS